jgi:hypothetical protein
MTWGAGAAAGAQAANKPTINKTPSTTLKLCFIVLSFEDWIFSQSENGRLAGETILE